jgi:hypothetical protein
MILKCFGTTLTDHKYSHEVVKEGAQIFQKSGSDLKILGFRWWHETSFVLKTYK